MANLESNRAENAGNRPDKVQDPRGWWVRRSHLHRLLLACAVIPLLLISLVANAAELLTRPEIVAGITELESGAAEDAAASRLLDHYREALRLFDQHEENLDATDAYRAEIDSAASRLEDLRKRLEQVVRASQKPMALAQDASLSEVEQQLARKTAELKLAGDSLSRSETLVAEERVRPQESAEELAEALKMLDEAELLSRIEATDDPEGQLRKRVSLLRLESLSSRVKRLEMERLTHAARLEQLMLKVEYDKAVLSGLERQVQSIQTRLTEQRSADVEQVRQEALQTQQKSSGKHPVLSEAAGINAGLLDQLEKVTAALNKVINQREGVLARLKLVQRNLEQVKQQLDIAGLDEQQAVVLSRQRQELPNPKKIATDISLHRQQIAEARLVQFRIEEQRETLSLQLQSAATEDELRFADVEPEVRRSIIESLTELLRDRDNLLNKLKSIYAIYETELGEIILEQTQLVQRVEQYGSLLDRHLVWTPNTNRVGFQTLKDAFLSLAWVLSPDNWRSALRGVIQSAAANPLLTILVLGVVLLLLRARRRMLASLSAISLRIGKVTQDSFLLTLKATSITLLLALPSVLLAALVALLLVRGQPDAFVGAVAQGVRHIVFFFLLMQLLRYFFIPHGLAEAHFRWSSSTIKLYRYNLNWLVPVLMPLVFITGFTEWQLEALYKESLGRLAFLVAVFASGLFFHRLLNPWSGVVRRQPGEKWSIRLLWYPFVSGLNLWMFALAFEGYYYSALTLENLIFWSIVIACSVYLLYNLSIRWVLVTDRQLAYTRALARRQAALEARATKEADGLSAPGEVIPDPQELENINLETISEQTRRVLTILAVLSVVLGLGLLWSQMMPALEKLDDLVLWTYQSQAGEARPYSLIDGLIAIVVILLTVAAGRNLPGLLEFALLQPLSLSPGNRYAIAMISSYLIYAAGFIIFFNKLGLQWGDIQWLIAAMGVGLGFGLKEIFSNFFSGLVLLFERPLRVGDTVTVGDISGTVSRIRMRATTITDWDNKELVVPNVQFLTDPLINWTLTDTVTRVKINLGVAYGSDTELTHRVILETVRQHPDVLNEPAPTAFFLGFGESSLDYQIYVFVNDRAKRLPVLHDLHTSLESAFRLHGIEIPFPQRDLHLRTTVQAHTPLQDPGEKLDD